MEQEEFKEILRGYIQGVVDNPILEDSSFLILLDPSKRELIDQTRSIKKTDLMNNIIAEIITNTIITGNFIKNTYETVNKNLKAYPYELNYVSRDLDTIVYTLPDATIITKTYTYTTGDLTKVVISGNTPVGIQLTKTLSYSSGDLIAVVYS